MRVNLLRAPYYEVQELADPRPAKMLALIEGRSMIRDYRIKVIQESCDLVHYVPGAVLEIGCFAGGTTQALAEFLGPERTIYAIDTFEGFPQDEITLHSEDAIRFMFQPGGIWADVYESTVRYLTPYKNVHVVKGRFPECATPEMLSEPLALVNLDTDTHASILNSLNFVWDRLSPGGVIQIDDWGRPSLHGVGTAIWDFLDQHSCRSYEAFHYPAVAYGYIVKI
jgi:SAM-dependent methyltransferase